MGRFPAKSRGGGGDEDGQNDRERLARAGESGEEVLIDVPLCLFRWHLFCSRLSSIARLEGTLLAYETRLGLADFAASGSSESLDNKNLVSLGPEGLLPLPKAFLREMRPEGDVRLSARIAPELSFQLSYYLG